MQLENEKISLRQIHFENVFFKTKKILSATEKLQLNSRQEHGKFVEELQKMAHVTFNALIMGKEKYKATGEFEEWFSRLVSLTYSIYQDFKVICEDEKTRLICYEGKGGNADIRNYSRYQFGLVTYDANENDVPSIAQIRYVCLMHYLFNFAKNVRAALFVQQLFLRMMVDDKCIDNIFAREKLLPQQGETHENRLILDEEINDWKTTSFNTTIDGKVEKDSAGATTLRSYGKYHNSNPDIATISRSLLSGHGMIFFNEFSKKNGKYFNTFIIANGWMKEVSSMHASVTPQTNFNKHERMAKPRNQENSSYDTSSTFEIYFDMLASNVENSVQEDAAQQRDQCLNSFKKQLNF